MKWTDTVTVVWTTTPGWSSSRHSIRTTYGPSTGFFSNMRFDVDAWTGNTFLSDSGSDWVPVNGSSTKWTYYRSMYGKSVWHLRQHIVSTRFGTTQRDRQVTAKDGCYSGTTRACKY